MTVAPPATAISVAGVHKAFVLPHEREVTFKQRIAQRFRPSGHDRLEVLRGVDFEVARGEFFGIAGRNGSGKSTLLKCVAGIYGPDAGTITVDGCLAPFAEMGVGFKPDLTARENVHLSAVILGLDRQEARRRADEILRWAEVEDFADVKLKNFSSGMALRLAFAVAFQVEADVLLLDEVLAVGDGGFRHKCLSELDRLKAEGRTVVIVTHNMDMLERLCDRALLLERGRIETIGEPAEIAARYDDVVTDQRPRPVRRSGAAASHVGPPPAAQRQARRAAAFGTSARRLVSLTRELAVAEFRLHYEGSALGYLWSVMRPLLLFAVLYAIFASRPEFGEGVKHYPVYLLFAVVLWTFFAETASTGVTCLVRSEGLLRRLRFPRLCIPLAVVAKALLNLGLNGIAVVVLVVLVGVEPRLSWLELPLLVLLLAIFAAGVAMLLSALQVRFKDTLQVWSVLQQLLFFGCPIFYVVAEYPDAVRGAFAATPIPAVLTEVRHAVVDPAAPSAAEVIGGPAGLLVPVAIAAGVFCVGAWVFVREAPRIAERL
jgi:ABC-type polysaccharide/polyol phosphate transport system ATPase subunit/ABC-type polysaccharide/polyol phosphate export permease